MSNKSAPLVVVSADAGYGKTTFIAQMLQEQDGINIWYHLDRRDYDPEFFISHLTEAINRQVPGFGEWVEERHKQARDIRQEKEAVLTSLVNELAEKSEQPVHFFFDDYHVLPQSGIFGTAVQFLVTHLPEDCLVIISGRGKPDLPLARLRSQRAVVEIGKAELQFTLEETAELLANVHKPVSQKQIDKIHERTEGWPAMLTLLQAMIMQQGAASAIRQLPGDPGTEYLTNEVWKSLDPQFRRIFMECSLLDPVVVELYDRVIELDESCGRFLRQAEERNIMITRLGDENIYRFHPLFREFLQQKLMEDMGSHRVKELHLAYAENFTVSHDYEDAIKHFFAAQQFERAAQVIDSCGLDMLEAGRSQTVDSWIGEMPPALFTSHPWLHYFKSQINERRGNLQQALDELSLAENLFMAANDRKGMLTSALARGEILANQNRHEESLKAYGEGPRWADTREEKIFACNRLGVQSLLCGHTKESLKHFDCALALCDETLHETRSSISIYMLNPLYFKGDFAGIAANTENVILDGRPILDRFTVYFYRILALFELGSYEAALAVLDEAETHFGGEKLGFELAFDGLRGQNLLFSQNDRLGRKTIVNLFRQQTEHKMLGPDCALIHMGAIERCRGNFQAAQEIHQRALEVCYEDGKPYSIANALQQSGASSIRSGGKIRSRGEAQLDEALGMAEEGGYEYLKTQVFFHRAWLALQHKNTEAALMYLKSSLELAARYRHDHFLTQEGAVNIDLLSLAFCYNVQRRYLTEIFGKIGAGALKELKILLDSQDDEIRNAAIQLFANTGGSQAIPYVRKLTKHKDPAVRETALAALNKMRLSTGSLEEMLSAKELQVLELMAEGLSNLEIAGRMFISESTVKTHVSRIFNKLGFNKRAQVVAFYHRKAT